MTAITIVKTAYTASDVQRIKAYVKKEFPQIEQIIKKADATVSDKNWSALKQMVSNGEITSNYSNRRALHLIANDEHQFVHEVLSACGSSMHNAAKYGLIMADGKMLEGKLESARMINYAVSEIAFSYGFQDVNNVVFDQRDKIESMLLNASRSAPKVSSDYYKHGVPTHC